VSADPAGTRRSVAQTFADVERLARWLTQRDPGTAGRLGIMGLSLGAFVASSVFALDPQFGCGVFVLAGGDVADALYSGAPDVQDVRAALRARGETLGGVRRAYAQLSPATMADPARGDRVLLVNAMFDRVISRANAERLGRAWGNPARFWVPGGHHSAVLFLDPFLDRCEAHLRRWLEW
jgi:dipeptidyl aminopeptidase/acylaminoacyl peptidase